ncbi:unnamed protein product, partial [Mesorhabditis spiculigera]
MLVFVATGKNTDDDVLRVPLNRHNDTFLIITNAHPDPNELAELWLDRDSSTEFAPQLLVSSFYSILIPAGCQPTIFLGDFDLPHVMPHKICNGAAFAEGPGYFNDHIVANQSLYYYNSWGCGGKPVDARIELIGMKAGQIEITVFSLSPKASDDELIIYTMENFTTSSFTRTAVRGIEQLLPMLFDEKSDQVVVQCATCGCASEVGGTFVRIASQMICSQCYSNIMCNLSVPKECNGAYTCKRYREERAAAEFPASVNCIDGTCTACIFTRAQDLGIVKQLTEPDEADNADHIHGDECPVHHCGLGTPPCRMSNTCRRYRKDRAAADDPASVTAFDKSCGACFFLRAGDVMGDQLLDEEEGDEEEPQDKPDTDTSV